MIRSPYVDTTRINNNPISVGEAESLAHYAGETPLLISDGRELIATNPPHNDKTTIKKQYK